jgi:flagellar motor switch protein FliM
MSPHSQLPGTTAGLPDTSPYDLCTPGQLRPLLLDAMLTAEARVEELLSGSSLCMRDLLALAPGKVLALGPPANCSVECVINGVSKFRAELISNGRNQALQIGAPIEIRPGPRG